MDKVSQASKAFPANTAKEQRKENKKQSGSDTKILITSGDELHKIFSSVQYNLNVVHDNCQSIPAHYMQMLSTFDSNIIDAILVSETFLKSEIDSKEVDLPGFKLIRNDRSEKGCGGVAIYLREDIIFKIIDRSPNEYSMSAEHLFIEISNKGITAVFGVFYSPSLKINYFKHFNDLVKRHRTKYDHFFCLGDFNTDLLKNNSRSKTLLSIIDNHNLNILPIGPTHIAPHSAPSVLDLIIVSNLDNVEVFGQLAGCFSYHDILYLSYRLDFKNKVKPTTSSSPSEGIQQFLQSTRVREGLARQLNAMKKYKSRRTQNDFEEYQKCRELVKKLETEFKREKKKCKILQEFK